MNLSAYDIYNSWGSGPELLECQIIQINGHLAEPIEANIECIANQKLVCPKQFIKVCHICYPFIWHARFIFRFRFPFPLTFLSVRCVLSAIQFTVNQVEMKFTRVILKQFASALANKR